jgi:hypothetical protein
MVPPPAGQLSEILCTHFRAFIKHPMLIFVDFMVFKDFFWMLLPPNRSVLQPHGPAMCGTTVQNFVHSFQSNSSAHFPLFLLISSSWISFECRCPTDMHAAAPWSRNLWDSCKTLFALRYATASIMGMVPLQ